MDLDQEEIDYDIEFTRLTKRFPEANFVIALPFHEDKILCKDTTIFLKINYNCYCYKNAFISLPPMYIKVEKNNKNGISYADCIDKLIESEFNSGEMCNHRFLEIIEQIKDSITYECWFGS